jgi:hypothetical protein
MGKGGSVESILVPKDEGTRPLNNVKQEQIHLAKLAAKVGLCHTCHVARTRQQRQRKDQQGKLSTPKGVRSV